MVDTPLRNRNRTTGNLPSRERIGEKNEIILLDLETCVLATVEFGQYHEETEKRASAKQVYRS